MYGFGVRSAQNCPPKSVANNGKAPGSVANATKGNISGHGSGDSYPPKKGGNNFKAPDNVAKASEGHLAGHASQKQEYPKKGGMEYPESSGRVVLSKTGNDHFSPRGGNML